MHYETRSFDVDALRCEKCSAQMVVLAFITAPDVLEKILSHLRQPTSPPPLSPARVTFDVEPAECAGSCSAELSEPESVRNSAESSRGPPR